MLDFGHSFYKFIIRAMLNFVLEKQHQGGRVKMTTPPPTIRSLRAASPLTLGWSVTQLWQQHVENDLQSLNGTYLRHKQYKQNVR